HIVINDGGDAVEQLYLAEGGAGAEGQGKDREQVSCVFYKSCKHESEFRWLIAVDAFTEDVVDTGACAGQSPELDLEEQAGIVVKIIPAQKQGVIPVHPAPGDHAGAPTAAGIFDAGKDLEFLA